MSNSAGAQAGDVRWWSSAAASAWRAACLVAVLAAAWVEAAQAAPAPARPTPPSRSVALVERKCGTCHAAPAARSRRNWVGASVKMHERRVALSPEEWALIRDYLGESSATAAR